MSIPQREPLLLLFKKINATKKDLLLMFTNYFCIIKTICEIQCFHMHDCGNKEGVNYVNFLCPSISMIFLLLGEFLPT